MRNSRINPKLSAYAQLFGQFDYNATPLAPPGCKCIIHDKPTARKSWAVHGTKAYYTAPAMRHYRCYEVHVQRTLAKRIADTVTFLPHNLTMPNLISTTNAIDRIKDLIKLLNNYQPHHPLANHNDDSITALQTLTDIFKLNPTKTVNKNITNNHVATTKSKPYKVTKSFHPNTTASPRVPVKANDTPNTNQYTANLPTTVETKHHYNTRSKAHKANAVLNTETGQMEEYRQLQKGKDKIIWQRSFSNEIGRLAQGIRDIIGTDCITFIAHSQIPKGKKVAYARIVCAIRPQKKETHRTRITIGGNLLTYDGKTKTPTADLITLKLLLNSVLSTKNAKFLTIDIKNFYLATKLKNKQYMFLPADLIPKEIMDSYKLHDLIHNGKIYMAINKGIYGLKEAGILANEQLKQHLAPYGYAPTKFTPGLWKHQTNNNVFALVVDDFALKYIGDDNASHLINALKDKYEDVEVN